MEQMTTKGLLEFLDNSKSVFHTVKQIKTKLLNDNFIELFEEQPWKLEKGKNYFTTKNSTSIIAFKVPKKEYVGFNIVASHSDSPSFKIKENPEITVNDEYITLNTERYGGMIMSTWLDRPLSVAGRVIVKENDRYTQKLVDIDKDLLIIPNLAIHMDKSANENKTFNPQVDMLPLIGGVASKDEFIKLVAENAGVKPEDISASDLYLYNRQKGCVFGAKDEYVGAAKLDDLQCVYGSMIGFLQAEVQNSVAVLAVFDNEEVGSGTKQGAASTLLFDVLTRAENALGYDNEHYLCSLANSFMISADNAHAVHPNQASVSDPTNKPYINKGIVIKYNANQKYTSDAISATIFKDLAKKAGVNCQSYTNRSDMQGGSTLGNIASTKVAINAVDIGLPQLAMHSAYETAGVKDTEDFIKVCKSFYGVSVVKQGEQYTVK